MVKVLLTGSQGYIGSCFYEQYKNKFEFLCVDKIKRYNQKKFFKINLLNKKKLNQLIKKNKPNIVIHLAAKSTLDDIEFPNLYKSNNLVATQNLLDCMIENQINNIIFSSTANLFKSSKKKLREGSKIKLSNPYSKSKFLCEKLIRQNKNINFIIFRFFNVCSSLPNYQIGENHHPETHLIPKLYQYIRKNKTFEIYGKNFQTRDGTCIRDYIHIKDINRAIKKAVIKIQNNKIQKIINLGNSRGFSVLEIINSFKKILKRNIKFKFVKKRKGDPTYLVCNNEKSKKILNLNYSNSNLKKIIKDEIIFQDSSIK